MTSSLSIQNYIQRLHMDKLFFTVMIGSCRCDCVMEVSLVQIHFAYKSWVVCRFQPFIFRGVFVHCISDSLAQIQGKLHQITGNTPGFVGVLCVEGGTY